MLARKFLKRHGKRFEYFIKKIPLMSLQKLGLRYERLLILSAPISLACILVTFVAIASDAATYKQKAACFDQALAFLESNKNELKEFWEEREMIGNVMFANKYVSETSIRSIGKIDYGCDRDILRQNTNTALSPEKFSEFLKTQLDKIRAESEARPVRSYGIEIPQKATISIGGIAITTNIVTAAQAMQLILMPILLLWLGSLFTTRYRETILIESAKTIYDLHPHAMNLYLNSEIPQIRKKSWCSYYGIIIIRYFPTIFRVFVLSIFILPPTIFYCFSLFFLGAIDYVWISIISGTLVSLFSLVNLIGELQAWHSGKTFPGPKCHRTQI